MNLENNQRVECSFFESAFKTQHPMPILLEDYFNQVKNGTCRVQVERMRSLEAAGDSEKARIAKKYLPLVVAGGVMENGRKREHMVRYSQCVTVDLDHVPSQPAALLRQAQALDYVKAGHISPSGTGLKLFVMVDSDLAHHEVALALVSRMVEHDLPGVKADPSGKDPNRGCFMSYDPDAFYKDVSRVVGIPLASAQDMPAPTGASALSNYIDKFEQGNPFAGGVRHSFLVKLASALNSAGFAEMEVAAECLRRYTEPGFTDKEIGGIVSDIYRRYSASHGSKNWSPQQPEKTGVRPTNPTCPTPFPGDTPFEEESPLGNDIELEDAHLPHFDRGLTEHLPRVLADAVRPAADATQFDLLLIGSISVCSTLVPGVTGNLKHEWCAPPLYTLLIGPSGSGKGCITPLAKMAEPWQKYVFDNSHHKVEEYKKQKEAYELYKMQERQGKKKTTPGTPPEEPTPVYQKELHLGGYTSTARMIEQLEINYPYASLLFESELESVNNTLGQDFGSYGYILNQAFHHETITSSSKSSGTHIVRRPLLGFLATGTPSMFSQLLPSTESGLFSRLMTYRIHGFAGYQPLSSSDSNFRSAFYYDDLGQRMLDIAIHLDGSPTFVSFSDKQRKRLDRYFEREYYNVRVFGNDDVTSVVLRHRLIIFRIAMVLTALRKGEKRDMELNWEISDRDFETAFHIGTTAMKHSLVVSTSMKHGNQNQHYKMVTAQLDVFADMPDEFTTQQVVQEASVRGISRSCIYRMLKSANSYKLVISERRGCYQKTDKGKNVRNSEKGVG